MPKPDKALVELKRQVRILLALDGRVLRLRSGVWLLLRGRVADPILLASLIGAAGFERNTLRACLSKDAVCEPLSRQHLAAATHALVLLHTHRKLLFDTPARWLGGSRRDATWLSTQRARVQRLATYQSALADGCPDAELSRNALAAWFDSADCPDCVGDQRSQQLAWLCDRASAPTSPIALAEFTTEQWPRTLARVAEHGPRDFALAAELVTATRWWSDSAAAAWWPWLAQGVSVGEIEAWPEASRARTDAAPSADWPLPAVQVYVRLASALLRAPGGSRLKLQPEAFARLASARKPTLVALAAALDQALHGARHNAEQTLIWTDVVLRLHDQLAAQSAPPMVSGLGVATDPEFSAWLGQTDLLDCYLGLRRALGEATEVSTRLRQDYATLSRVDAQRSYLTALPPDDPRRAQLARLPSAADPARTQRRLNEECARMELRWRMAQADLALQRTLNRVLGVSAPHWDEAWRDAARLYLAVDHNHAELKQLLRAAARGQAESLRGRLPGNLAWLQRAAEYIDTETWLDPPRHALELRGEAFTLTAERDPLQALRMGMPFASCLAIDAGSNRHSAIINALDANKWVVYLRDRRERIVARQLLAISTDWQLLGYRVYTRIGTPPGMLAAFAEYANALADSCGLVLADRGQPETLNGQNWYDDGTWSWPPRAGTADTLVPDYCRELDLPVPIATEDELRDEARRWRLAVTGNIAALPSWADTLANGWRNRRLLEHRYGWPSLCRLLGDDVRRDRYRLERIREAPLATQLHARREFLTAHGYRPGHELIENAVDLAALRVALREIIDAPAGTVFDDRGLEHALLTLVPRWAETTVFSELARVLPLMAGAFARLRSGLPEDCASCVDVGEDWLLQALRNAWRRAPDAALMLRLLGARHDGAQLPRWLLAVAAREHLQQPAKLPVFDPPRFSRPVLRALAGLTLRFPELRRDPLFLAAVLRHSDAQTLDVDNLPWPEVAPWEALGDAILFWPRLWPLLRRYARQPSDSTPCGIFEAFWQRQVASAWREHLPARVAALDETSLDAARSLADIGLVALTEQAGVLLQRRPYRAKLEPKRSHDVRELLRHAHSAGKLGAISHAWQELHGELDNGPGRRYALAWLVHHPQARSLVDALIDLSEAPAWAGDFLLQMLPGSHNRMRYLRLAAHPQWADMAKLCAPQIWSASSARRLLQQLPQDLGEHWLVEQLQSGNEDLIEDGPPEWYQRLAALAARHCPPEMWIKLYAALPDALAASIFIHALSATEHSAIRALVPADASGRLVWLA